LDRRSRHELKIVLARVSLEAERPKSLVRGIERPQKGDARTRDSESL
jgi:hypothetical protein